MVHVNGPCSEQARRAPLAASLQPLELGQLFRVSVTWFLSVSSETLTLPTCEGPSGFNDLQSWAQCLARSKR